jgi:hypothetical protein
LGFFDSFGRGRRIERQFQIAFGGEFAKAGATDHAGGAAYADAAPDDRLARLIAQFVISVRFWARRD